MTTFSWDAQEKKSERQLQQVLRGSFLRHQQVVWAALIIGVVMPTPATTRRLKCIGNTFLAEKKNKYKTKYIKVKHKYINLIYMHYV